MGNNPSYQVFPSEIKPTTVKFTIADWKRTNGSGVYGCSGCLVMILLFLTIEYLFLINKHIIISYLGDAAPAYPSIALLFSIAFSVSIAFLVSRCLGGVRLSTYENKMLAEANERERARAANEAKSLTESVMQLYASSAGLATEIPKHIEHTASFLRIAEREYTDNAFTPFWDAIENAARHLAECDEKIKTLSKTAQSYYQHLRHRKHNFPPFPCQLETLPDISSLLGEFRRVIRLGQTNYQFASIWEQYRNRKIMLAGFHHLGEAINNLGYALEDSISGLQESISSNTAQLVEEEIKTRGVIANTGSRHEEHLRVIANTGNNLDKRLLEQNRMLDNIQHGRKPKYEDTPSKE